MEAERDGVATRCRRGNLFVEDAKPALGSGLLRVSLRDTPSRHLNGAQPKAVDTDVGGADAVVRRQLAVQAVTAASHDSGR